MIYFTDAEIDQLINEDIPYYDLTSLSVKLGTKVARMSFSTRHETVICGTEEVLKIFEKFKITPTLLSVSGEQIEEGIKFLEGEGLANNLHAVWRTTANLLEFASGIATRTKSLVDIAHEVNPYVSIVTTRRSIPFTRKLAVKAIRIGGGDVFRLGLSDTILIFENHIKFLGGLENFIKKLPEIRQRAAGRELSVEVMNEKDAITLAKTEIETIHLNKITAAELKPLIREIRKIKPGIKICASDSINIDNIREYASSGADFLITSYPYFGKSANFNINIDPVYDL